MGERRHQETKAVLTGSIADNTVGYFSLRKGINGVGIQVKFSEDCVSPNSTVDEDIDLTNDTFTDASHGYETGLIGSLSVVIGCAEVLATGDVTCGACTAFAISHTLTAGEKGQWTACAGTLPTGLFSCIDYYAIDLGTCSFAVAASREDALATPPVRVTVSDTGCTGPFTFTPSGSLPTGLCSCACMAFIIKIDDNTYKISATRGGAAQDITALNSPASIVFTPTATSCTALSNGSLTFKATVNSADYILLPCILPASAGLAQGGLASTITIDPSAFYNEIEVTADILLGQWTIDVDIVGK